jgi:N4 Gp49/Sf6 Gp66 family protein
MDNATIDSNEIPRVKPEDLEAQVINEQYYKFPDSTVTVCCLTMRNGFNTVGSSACADVRLFDKDLGEQFARKDAISKMWPLLGYALRDSIHKAAIIDATYKACEG